MASLNVLLILFLQVPGNSVLMHLVHGLCCRARNLAEFLLGALRHELVVKLLILERLAIFGHWLLLLHLLQNWLLLIHSLSFILIRHGLSDRGRRAFNHHRRLVNWWFELVHLLVLETFLLLA